MNGWSAEFALTGAGGEPVDLWRTIMSHGVVDLPPMRIDEERRVLETTLAFEHGEPRTGEISSGRAGYGRVTVHGPEPASLEAAELLAAVRHILRLDEDLSEFYAIAAADPELAWAAAGAGRMVRSQTVFEEVVKTICTTNCAWSATVRMVTALVENLGAASNEGQHAFPTAAAMAQADESFYRDVARSGYRGAYLRSLATSVAEGSLDLEQLKNVELDDDAVAERLLALPGVGPYAAAHIMMLLGRYSRLILDSWTRPKYARVNGRKASDKTIERRFRRYKRYAGLAFWLYLTRDWVAESA
jgi:N-glycosylase/DNA lyase